MERLGRNLHKRRHLSPYERIKNALGQEPKIKEKAKEKQGERTDLCQISDKSTKPAIDTKKQLAAVAGVSHLPKNSWELISRGFRADEVKKVCSILHRLIRARFSCWPSMGDTDEFLSGSLPCCWPKNTTFFMPSSMNV